MATQVQLRRGTSAENDAFTGALGEVTVDTTNNTLRVHDGSTAGGFPVAPSSTTASKDLDNLSNTGKANISAQGTYDSGATYNAGTVGKAIQGKANVDMDNLTAAGKNIGLWCNNAANIITKIPQDINLTLSSGTLTLKSGSKVYVPNGTGIFDIVNITADKTTSASANGKWVYFINESGNLQRWAVNECFSGTTAPTSIHYPMWYDTTNNIIKSSDDHGSTWTGKFSFPIAIVTVSGGAISSIDQVFNGIGYIGSTVFALPGIKALAPNGRNSDGTLKNELRTTNVVSTVTTSTNSTDVYIAISGAGSIAFSVSASRLQYKESENKWYDSQNGYAVYAMGARVKIASTKITELLVPTVFHAVDYNDTDFIAHQAMPSSRYTDLTLPATGGTITAQADGYLTVNKSATAAGQYINFINGSNGMNCNSIATGALPLRLCMPVSKGDVITINYDAAGTTTMFRFIYANGAK